ncbi:M48 family metallopeptidase [Microvirga flavescens]|uniref:M48 family metallopeptidase n=1 Tax=Microvirga flavescens TaxID=2249811 RepID=UPI000DD98189|nr:M48 family metallopeptidase [Microvirga flavescens]
MGLAVFYDGKTARRRVVSLVVTTASLDLYEDGETIASWPCNQVRQHPAAPGVLRLGPENPNSLARLDVTDAGDQAEVFRNCLFLTTGARKESTGRIVFWSLAATASLIVSAYVLVPILAEKAAPLVPVSVEKQIGAAVDKQIQFILGEKTCNAPAGAAALAKLSSRLSSVSPSKIAPEIQVISSKIPNAIALPGGRIYLFKGLLDKADNVDAIAGVLAHEIGHVRHRDSLRRLMQTSGTSFLLGLLFGDVTGSGAIILATRMMMDGAYSRDAERQADENAIAAMLALGRSPRPMGLLLSEIDKGENGPIPSMLSSHPLTTERLETFSKRTPTKEGEPLLSNEEWTALKGICEVKEP